MRYITQEVGRVFARDQGLLDLNCTTGIGSMSVRVFLFCQVLAWAGAVSVILCAWVILLVMRIDPTTQPTSRP